MFVIINTNTNKIIQTINSSEGLQVNENHLLQEITDETLISKINVAHDYTLVFDVDGNVTDITVSKTQDEWQAEQPIPEVEPTPEEYLVDLDYRLSLIELGL
jgi:hypothetical protein